MRRILHKLFSRELESPNISQVINWWGNRWIAYNLILLISGIINIALLCTLWTVNKWFNPPISFNIFAPIFFFIIANIFYSLGLLTELFIRVFKRNTNFWGVNSFKAGVAFSICCIFFPTILFYFGGIINNERFSNPVAHFAKHLPTYGQLSGAYKIDLNKRDYVKDADINMKPELILNPDSTFSVSNFPVFVWALTDYQLCNGKGRWSMKHSSFSWPQIELSYTSLHNAYTQASVEGQFAEYYIYNDEPPYKICEQISDPDMGAWIIFEKE